MRSTLRFLPALIICCTLAGISQARPAYWHWWTSKIDGAGICIQTPPGPGWQYRRGPYRDARCSQAAGD